MNIKKSYPALVTASLISLIASMPQALAAPYVYVPLGSEAKIVVVDAETDRIIETITGIEAVHGLAKSPNGDFLYAGSFEERDSTESPTKKPAAISEDEHAAHHSGSSALELGSGQVVSTLSVIKTKTGTIIRRIDVPGAVHHVSVSPDGRLAAVTHPSEGSISVLNLKSYEVVSSVLTGPLPNYALFSPDSKRIYVSNAGNGTVSEVDTARLIVRQNFVVGDGPEHLAMSRDGRNIYVANTDGGTVSEITVDSGSVTRTFDIGGALHGIDISESIGTLFVSALDKDTLIGIDLKSGEKRLAPLGPAPYHAAVIGGTRKLYISSADLPVIWVVDKDSLSIRGRIAIGGKAHQMVVLSDR